mgnify:CR=1 FL=1
MTKNCPLATDDSARGRPKDEEKRKAILASATCLFMENGFDGTSMVDVAKAAGVSKQTVYSHFSSKQQLFKSAIDAKMEDYLPRQALTAVQLHTLEADLLAIGSRFCQLIFSDDAIAMHRILAAAASNNDKLARIFWETGPDEMLAQFAHLLDHYVASGDIKIANTIDAAQHFAALLHGNYHTKRVIGLLKSIDDIPIEKHVTNAVHHFIKSYG